MLYFGICFVFYITYNTISSICGHIRAFNMAAKSALQDSFTKMNLASPCLINNSTNEQFFDFLRLIDFQNYLEYFEYYIHELVRRVFGSRVHGSGELSKPTVVTESEVSQISVLVMLNTAPRKRNSDIIVKTNRSLEVSGSSVSKV